MFQRFWPGLFMALALVSCQRTEPPKMLIVGTSPDLPPFEYIESDKGLMGFEIDLVNLISTQIPREVSFKTEPFDNLIPELIGGQINFIASSMSPTEERKTDMAFTRTFYAPAFYMVKKTNSSSLEDHLNQQMGALSTPDTSVMLPIFRNHLNVSVTLCSTTTQLLNLLKTDKCNFILLDQKNYRQLKREVEKLALYTRSIDHPYDAQTFAPLNDFMKADLAALRESRGFAFAVRKTDLKLLETLNTVLDKLEQNRAIEALLDKWELL